MTDTFEVVIGLEVHIELLTQTKLFCACPASFGQEPNENVCPACAGAPGLPAVLNKRAVELAIKAALLTNCEISPMFTFDKKSYFYPDLPTGYQITQLFAPIAKNGYIDLDLSEGYTKRITIKQIHIEEDAGKLVHAGGMTLCDYNRAGVPLIEIVSNPDFRAANQVKAYLEQLRSLLSFAGVSDCKMQKGSMRCDVNISVREAGGNAPLGVRSEIKNMNSLKAITAAIEYESERHINALIHKTETLIQETRGWDEENGVTYPLRDKETAQDYRYFPNPEILPVYITPEQITAARATLPMSAAQKYEHLTGALALPAYDAQVITASRNLTRIFDEVYALYEHPKDIANWIITELLGAKDAKVATEDIAVNTASFARLLALLREKTINRATAKELLVKILREDIDLDSYISENNLALTQDSGLLDAAIREVLRENEKTVIEYKNGSEKVLSFLIGQTMKKLKGKADPAAVSEALKAALYSPPKTSSEKL